MFTGESPETLSFHGLWKDPLKSLQDIFLEPVFIMVFGCALESLQEIPPFRLRGGADGEGLRASWWGPGLGK